MERKIFHYPAWVAWLYGIAAVVLIPWIYVVATGLPERQLAQHWDLAWTVFDGFEAILLIGTFLTAVRRSIWLALIATSLSTVLVIDAWFDVVTAHPGEQQVVSLLFAVVFELPLATSTMLMAYRATVRTHRVLLKLK